MLQKDVISLHPLSPLKNGVTANEVLRNIFEKKFTKNLVVSKISITFATAFRS